MIAIEKITNSKNLKQFIDFPHQLYKDDPNYVPELFVAQKDLLDPKKHPFFSHSKLDLFLAIKNGKPVGRIAAIRNNNHLKYTGKSEAFFGFYDSINDVEISHRLFDTAVSWTKREGIKTVLGPTNFSTNETCGLLVDGFQLPPVVMMTYNKPYYSQLVESYGFKKRMDLLAYNLEQKQVSEKSLRLASLIESRLEQKGIVIRTMSMRNFESEVEKIKTIYNKAWDKNWGFIPMTDEEFQFMAKDMKMIIDPDFCFIAEQNGKPIGFSLSIPDMNQVLINVKKGRLLPTGIFKLLFNKKKINRVRIITLGVLEEYRKLGIEACFYAMNITTGRKKGITCGEASWVLEDNEMMNRAMVNINGNAYKRYRIYEMTL